MGNCQAVRRLPSRTSSTRIFGPGKWQSLKQRVEDMSIYQVWWSVHRAIGYYWLVYLSKYFDWLIYLIWIVVGDTRRYWLTHPHQKSPLSADFSLKICWEYGRGSLFQKTIQSGKRDLVLWPTRKEFIHQMNPSSSPVGKRRCAWLIPFHGCLAVGCWIWVGHGLSENVRYPNLLVNQG